MSEDTDIVIVPKSDPLQEPPKFPITEATIEDMSAAYLPLTINGLEDKLGYENVHSARLVVKKHRCQVENTRVALKADAVKYGKTVDGEAKRLKALLAPIEAHLVSEEKAIEDAKESIREEKRQAAEAEAQAVKDAEAAEVKRVADEEAARVKAEQDAEDERLRVAGEKMKAEQMALRMAQTAQEVKQRHAQQKLADERLAYDKQVAADRQAVEDEQKQWREKAAEKQREAQKKLDEQAWVIEVEKQRLADIEAERVRAVELEKAKAEAAEQAKKDTETRIAREKEEAEVQAEEEKAAKIRAEELRPDREKLFALADEVNAIEIPAMRAGEMVVVTQVLQNAANEIRGIAEGME